jgi:eukaryotic-like serine/threonine-protein kinase
MRWSYDTTSDGDPVQFHTDPVVGEDLIVTGSDLVHGHARVYAFERDTGKPRWKREVGWGASGDVLRVGSNVYVVTYQDELLCLDWKTGEILWKFATGRKNDEAARGAAPAAADGRVFFGSLDGTVYALDGRSGAVLWKRELGAGISTSVLFAGGSLYAGTTNLHLYRLDSKSGTVTGNYSAGEQPYGRLLAAEGSVLSFFSEKKLVSLLPSLESVRWTEATSGPWTSSRPYAWNHAILAGNERGELFALRSSDGVDLWSAKFDSAVRGIGSDDEVLYVGTIRGRVYAWAPPKSP